MLTFLVETLGCKLNQLESEAISDAFKQAGFIDAGTGDWGLGTREEKLESNPSIIIINTCTVTSKADQKARRVIRKALRDYPDSFVIVTGCYAQLNKDDILKLNADNTQRLFVIEKDKIINFIESLDINNSTFHISNSAFVIPNSTSVIPHLFHFNPKQFSKHTRAFLKIQDGCDKRCAYCKIRLARGKSVSLNAGEILSRLRILEQTHAEAALTGVNICQYKEEKVLGLSELLDYLLSGTEKIAIRLSSLAPESVDEKLAKVLSHPRIRPHFHLSVQSCSDSILDRMGRPYNSETVVKAVNLLRGAKNAPFLACDIITGFPGETEIEYNETYEIIKKLNFAWIHVFPFSKRAGTEAFNFSGAVAESEVIKRARLLSDLAKHGRAEYVRQWLGKDVDVLIEKTKNLSAGLRGVSDNYLQTLLQCDDKTITPGTVLRCKLLEEGNFNDFDVIALKY